MARTPPGSATCPGTRPSPSPWAPPPYPGGPAARALTLTAAIPLVGLTRLYVGAHLPLDIAGGAALGLAANAAVDLALARPAGESVPASGISRMPDGAPARMLES